jgi:[protein-PII] uridylyltransferase
MAAGSNSRKQVLPVTHNGATHEDAMSGMTAADTASVAPPVAQQPPLSPVLGDSLRSFSGDISALRATVVPIIKAHLAALRDEVCASVRTQPSGLASAKILSDGMDRVLVELLDVIVSKLMPAATSAGERMALCATGGYGRGTLAPGSDIDVLFLLPFKQTPWCESVTEAMLYVLWDLGLKVGHATRSVEDCVREARADLTVRTALLEARFLAGDSGLFQELVRRFDREVVYGTAADFSRQKLEERDQRVAKAGGTRYLVEPNVKEGKGGLRDLNTLFWIAKYIYRVETPQEFVAVGLFTERELKLFLRCENFLWRVRILMHIHAGRAEERLSFHMQRLVASDLNYRQRGGLTPVERFMKHYFMVAKDVGDLTAIVCAALEAREHKPRAMLDRFMVSLRRRRRRIAGSQDFVIDNGRLTVTDNALFERDPVNLIRMFHIADRHDVDIHPDATRLVTLSLKRIDQRLRDNPDANRLFIEILTSKHAPAQSLRRMHETNVLPRFIPEFGRILAMMQFSSYHHYTVDEHTLRAIGVLADVAAGRLKNEHPVANEIFPTVQNRRALYMALLLHDIGKGRDEDHSVVGERIARQLCPRFGFTEAETETVAWLVKNHLLMSNTAQHRDIMDPKTIESFVGMVQTLERLKLLLILTVCDIKAVGPGVWNGWKGQLLRTLYWEAEIVLAGGHSAMNRQQRVSNAQEDLRKLLPNVSAETFAAYCQRHYAAYWLKVDTPRKVRHAALIARAEAAHETMMTETATDAFRGVTELTVLALDHPRLLAIITGACAAAGANIVEAQIFTTTDGLAIDTIFVSRAFSEDADELRRADRVATHIVRTLKGEIRLPDVVASRAKSQPPPEAFQIVPDVVIDNKLSDRSTVVEVTGLDRPGLLYELTTAIGKLNLNINSARIVTFGEKAVDVFYVTDLTGGKIVNTQRQLALKRALLAVFNDAAASVPAQ